MLQKPDNLHEQAAQYWDSILADDTNFDRDERLAAAVGAISREDFVNFYEQLTAKHARKLWLLSGPRPEASDLAVKIVDDWEAFQEEQDVFVYP